jgi:UDP-N-acetylglucosamine 2-epimerase
VVGARPQFIKAAPVCRALRAAGRFDEILVHTGQHYDPAMSDVFFDELRIPKPDFHLGVGSGSHGIQTGAILAAVEGILMKERPAWTLVYGDTNSTLAAALAAVKLGIPVAHVEAGLRSFNRSMPEELNRQVADHVATLLFCTSRNAADNLAREGITNGVHIVGDVMADAFAEALQRTAARSGVLDRFGVKPGAFLLATIHRAENTDEASRLRSIVSAFGRIPEPIVFPIHPRTRNALAELGDPHKAHPNVRAVEPQGYLDMVMLEKSARLILTDSGGIQKEAYLLGTRCITLREETEWVETVESGWNKLVGVVPEKIHNAVEEWHPSGERPAFYGDGRAAEHIRNILLDPESYGNL